MDFAALALVAVLHASKPQPFLRTAIATINARTFDAVAAHDDHRWTVEERAQLALTMTSIACKAVASSLTYFYISREEAKEKRQLTRTILGMSPVKGALTGAAIDVGVHWLVIRFTKGSTRTVGLGALAGVNCGDAIHDMRVANRIEARKRGAR